MQHTDEDVARYVNAFETFAERYRLLGRPAG